MGYILVYIMGAERRTVVVTTKTNAMVRVHTWYQFFFFFFHPIYYLGPSFLSLLCILLVTQIRAHIRTRLFSPLPLIMFVPCMFIAERFQLFHPSSTGVELRLPTLVIGALTTQHLILFIFCKLMKYVPHHGGIRLPEPTLFIILLLLLW